MKNGASVGRTIKIQTDKIILTFGQSLRNAVVATVRVVTL